MIKKIFDKRTIWFRGRYFLIFSAVMLIFMIYADQTGWRIFNGGFTGSSSSYGSSGYHK